MKIFVTLICILLIGCVDTAQIERQQRCEKNRTRSVIIMPLDNDSWGADMQLEQDFRQECFQVMTKFDLAQKLKAANSTIDLKNISYADYTEILKISKVERLIFGSVHTETFEPRYHGYDDHNYDGRSGKNNPAIRGAVDGANAVARANAGTFVIGNLMALDSTGVSKSLVNGYRIMKIAEAR